MNDEIFESRRDLDGLNKWYEQPFGQLLKSQIATELLSVLKPLPIREFLYLGVDGFEESLDHPPEKTLFFTSLDNGVTENTLPLEANSQDCVVLLHALDVAPDSHGVLREVDRIVAMGGYVVIVGFNMRSSWGLYRPLRNLYKWAPALPWQLHFYSIQRLRDWLNLLSFEVGQVRTLNYQPLLQNPAILEKFRLLNAVGRTVLPFFGNVYILAARKRTIPVTPVRLNWKLRSHLLKPGTSLR
jgi:SAM-dependent methyltransferase